MNQNQSGIAYFSMEIAYEPTMPTYSGGLGILAGDTIRSAADLGLPMLAVSLVHRAGFFHQHLDEHGNQREEPENWDPQARLEPIDIALEVEIEGRRIALRTWRYRMRGASGASVPVYLLDSDLSENDEGDRRLTDHLYGGDSRYRLAQEAILGIGGRMLVRALDRDGIATYHLNEGHSALLVLQLLEEHLAQQQRSEPSDEDVQLVRQHCVFTTHTPIPAGHDRFPYDLVRQVLGERRTALLGALGALDDGHLDMTHLALRGARYVNGVARRHGEVSRELFPHYPIHAITNGVHAATWTSPPFAQLFDLHVGGWRRDNTYLRYVEAIPLYEIEEAHARAKEALIEEIRQRTGAVFERGVLTLGFARRAAGYKRADLLFADIERLHDIAQRIGPIQIAYGGKAHPHDSEGREMIRRVFEARRALRSPIGMVYLENYEMALAAKLVAGVDVWLNTPTRPLEASGTSGMKAALNGVPSLSVLDGWWVEGCIEGVTGWAIGGDDTASDRSADAASLYDALERIATTFYREQDAFARVRRSAIALNGSFFNTQRMVAQYALNAYAGAN